MPYLKDKAHREILDIVYKTMMSIFQTRGFTGSINYLLFKLAKEHCKSYSDYQKFIGELEACKLEIYRRLAAPYEDEKIKENGDVE